MDMFGGFAMPRNHRIDGFGLLCEAAFALNLGCMPNENLLAAIVFFKALVINSSLHGTVAQRRASFWLVIGLIQVTWTRAQRQSHCSAVSESVLISGRHPGQILRHGAYMCFF